MWTPVRLYLKNFVSHEQTIYEFAAGKSTLIQGLNLDDDNRSNGSGKSGLIEGFYTCITGLQFRDSDLRLADVIANDADECDLLVIFQDKDDTFAINRTIHRKNGSTLALEMNDQPMQFGTIDDGNATIFKTLGISKEDFRANFVVNKESYVSFLRSSDTKKKDAIARFSGSDKIASVDGIVLKEVNDLSSQLMSKKSNVEILKANVTSAEENVLNAANLLEEVKQDAKIEVDKYNEKIQELMLEIEESGKLIVEKNKNIEPLDKSIKKITEEIAALNKASEDFDNSGLKEFEKMLNDLKTVAENTDSSYRDRLRVIKDAKSKLDTNISLVTATLQRLIKCPKCNHEFAPSGKSKEDIQKALDVDNIELKKVNKDIENADKDRMIATKKYEIEINEIKASIAEIKEQTDEKQKEIQTSITLKRVEKNKLETNLASLSAALRTLVNDGEVNLKSIEQYQKLIDTVEAKMSADRLTAFKNANLALINAEKIVKTAEDNIKDLEQQVADAMVWISAFKRFRTHLTNKAVGTIEGLTNNYLRRSKTNLGIRIEGYKILASKEIREKISVFVTRDGIDEGVFGKFSKGEKAMIEFASLLAMQHLANERSPRGLDLLFTDEITESIDAKGVEMIVNSLNNVGKTVQIITHTMHEQAQGVITVVKENKISTIR